MSFRLKAFIRGFTLTELLIASAILTIFMVGSGTFFLKGNQAAAKGTWRTHTIARARTGMKFLQTALDKTSYPSYTGPNAFDEISPWDAEASDYDLTFYLPFSKDSTEPVTFEAGVHEGTILQFITVSPYQVAPDLSVAQMGVATRYTFSFPIAADIPPRNVFDGNRGINTFTTTLSITAEEGTYSYDPAANTFNNPDFSAGRSRRITVPDVHRFVFFIFSSNPNPEYADETDAARTPALFPRITLQITLESRDPFDARLVITQDLIYMVNTQIRAI